MLNKLTKAVALAGAAGLLSVASMTGASAHQALEDDGVIDSGKETHAHDEAQHAGLEGHLPDTSSPLLDVVSRTRLSNVVEGKIADVGVLKTTAYLAAWGGQTCDKNGVHVVDIADVTAPREIGFIPSKIGSYPGEGIQAVSVSTADFTGDLLVANNETCNANTGVGGVNIYDVTNPAKPVKLMEGYGDDSTSSGAINGKAHEIHSVYAWDAGARAYAVIVDNEEAVDVDILDITDPRKPVLIAEYDLSALSGGAILQPDVDLDEVFLHDMVVKQIGGKQVMLASYWDGGYVQLDVTDPRKAMIINDSDFAALDKEAAESGLSVPPEGNAHQAEYTRDDRYVLAADEDFAPYALTGRNTTKSTPFVSSQGSDTTQLAEGQTLTGQSRYVGRACDTDAAVPAGAAGQIAVVERGVCAFTVKVANVIAAGGYDAAVIINREGSDGCNAALPMSVEGDLRTFGVAPREQGFALFGKAFDEAACLAGDGSKLSGIALGAFGDELSFSSYFDGWGYVHLFDRSSMKELDTYAIPEAHDPKFAAGFGDLSVHEVATSAKDASLAYVSYYAGGLRVIDIEVAPRVKSDPGGPRIVEKAAHIDGSKDTEGIGNNLWGVETFTSGGKEYVAASDRDFGLYIYEYKPVNAP